MVDTVHFKHCAGRKGGSLLWLPSTWDHTWVGRPPPAAACRPPSGHPAPSCFPTLPTGSSTLRQLPPICILTGKRRLTEGKRWWWWDIKGQLGGLGCKRIRELLMLQLLEICRCGDETFKKLLASVGKRQPVQPMPPAGDGTRRLRFTAPVNPVFLSHPCTQNRSSAA